MELFYILDHTGKVQHTALYSPCYFQMCQVAIEVEREEDEGGQAGETFTDYVSVFVFHS